MKIAIISTPYTNAIQQTQIDNVNRTKEISMKWWRDGYNVVSPVMNSAFMDNAAPHETFVRAVKELIDRLLTTKGDVLVMCEGWSKSTGCKAEYEYALLKGKEVRFDGCAKQETGEESEKPDKVEITRIISGEGS